MKYTVVAPRISSAAERSLQPSAFMRASHACPGSCAGTPDRVPWVAMDGLAQLQLFLFECANCPSSAASSSRYPNSNSRVDRHMHTRVSDVFQETPASPSAGLLGKPLQVIAGTIYLCPGRIELGSGVRVECVPVTTLRWKALDSQEWALVAGR